MHPRRCGARMDSAPEARPGRPRRRAATGRSAPWVAGQPGGRPVARCSALRPLVRQATRRGAARVAPSQAPSDDRRNRRLRRGAVRRRLCRGLCVTAARRRRAMRDAVGEGRTALADPHPPGTSPTPASGHRPGAAAVGGAVQHSPRRGHGAGRQPRSSGCAAAHLAPPLPARPCRRRLAAERVGLASPTDRNRPLVDGRGGGMTRASGDGLAGGAGCCAALAGAAGPRVRLEGGTGRGTALGTDAWSRLAGARWRGRVPLECVAPVTRPPAAATAQLESVVLDARPGLVAVRATRRQPAGRRLAGRTPGAAHLAPLAGIGRRGVAARDGGDEGLRGAVAPRRGRGSRVGRGPGLGRARPCDPAVPAPQVRRPLSR